MKACAVEDCTRKAITKGYCDRHYRRWRKHGDPMVEPIRINIGACSVDDCESAAHSKGMCTKHYQRWFKHGDPLVAKGKPRLPDNEVTYAAVHLRIKALCGPARLYRCVSCGAPAKDWACFRNKETASEVQSGATVNYSRAMEDYAPLCKLCHTALDAPDDTAREDYRSAKLSAEVVLDLRARHSIAPLNGAAEARRLGVSPLTVQRVLSGKTWVHLK